MMFLRWQVLLLLPALIALVLWVRRRARRRPRPVTTWMLFQRALRQTPDAAAPRRPLLRDLLQVLPAALVVLALALPVIPGDGGPQTVVVVDGSASMETSSGGESRTARGVREARELAGGPVRVVSATDGLPVLAANLRRGGESVVVVTDRPMEVAEGIGLVGITDTATNAGVTACGLDDEGGLLVRVGGARVRGPVILTVSGLDPITIGAGELPWRGVLRPPVDQASRLEVTVTTEGDANRADDRVVLARESARVSVGLPPRGQDALWRAFSAHPMVDPFRGEGPCDLRVGSGEGRHRLAVAPEAGASPRPVTGDLVCEGSSLTGTLSLPAVYKPTAGDGQVLARVGEAALVVAMDSGVSLLQDPDACDWPEDPTFPLLCDQLLVWLGLDGAATFRASPPAVLSLEETAGPTWSGPVARRPAPGDRVGTHRTLEPWLYAFAAVAVVLFGVTRLRARRSAGSPPPPRR